MDFLKKISRSVWNFLMARAEYRAQCLRHRGIFMYY